MLFNISLTTTKLRHTDRYHQSQNPTIQENLKTPSLIGEIIKRSLPRKLINNSPKSGNNIQLE